MSSELSVGTRSQTADFQELPNTPPQPDTAPSLPVKIIFGTVGTGINMGLGFAATYGIISGFEAVASGVKAAGQYIYPPTPIPEPGFLDQAWNKITGSAVNESSTLPVYISKWDQSMLSAFSVPASMVNSYCIPRLLGCREDTPYRLLTAKVVTQFATPLLSAVFCNALGYRIDPMTLVNQQLFNLGLWAIASGLHKAVDYLIPIEEEQIETQVNDLDAESLDALIKEIQENPELYQQYLRMIAEQEKKTS